MRTIAFDSNNSGSLLAGFASNMGDAIVRRRAEIEVRAARVEAELTITARSEFLANMNHELRTPLNAIMGFASMLRDDEHFDLSDDQRSDYAEYILQSADLLLAHINTILEVAALESGSVKVAGDVFEFGAILSESITRADVQANAANVSIERRDGGDEIAAWGDTQRTGQAVDHLLQAAIRSCDKGGRVLARACFDDKGWAEIAIRDNGVGLTEQEVRQSLEAFNEVHRGLDRSFAGPGVGYAVAKTFVEMQGGRFFIKSRKGAGTFVRVALPPPMHNTENKSQTDHKTDDAPELIGENTEYAA